jgi:hypothetical protein
MFSASGLTDIYYPMSAELYYAESKQDELGVIQKTWVLDRIIKCSIISSMSDKTLTGELKNSGPMFQYNSDVLLRTNEDIQKKKNGSIFSITEILLTNVKDPAGKVVWLEKNQKATQYELKTFVPSYNGFHEVEFYRGYLARSTRQNEVLY